MSNVGYDLDTSGGLMPLIRALTKPPDEDLNAPKPKKSQHPYYKRPGKGHNHDSCDACQEGGDLICCDRCPASFHLGCHDPPLEEGDIPHGQWLCKECRSSEFEKASSSTRSSRAQSPADDVKCRQLRTNRSNSTQKKAEKKIKEDESKKEKDRQSETSSMERETKLTPMEILVNAARVMNPRQFELPNEMRIPCPFPGTDKDTNDSGIVSVDSSGCVPLPAKLCYTCGGNCKHAPLLQCDYCPLLFHQDCLDPPLTALPSGRWMCPNHVQQYIDWKLVNSVSATERVALWDKFTGPVDQHAIKLDFIRLAKKARPPFRIKVRGRSRVGRVCVPPMVKYHYQNPPPLLPSRREYVRCKNYMKNHPEYVEEVDRSIIAHKICMNLECPSYLMAGGRCKCDDEDTDTSGTAIKVEEECQPPETKRRKTSHANSQSDEDMDSQIDNKESFVPLRDDCGSAASVMEIVNKHLEKLDHRLVKLLAFQRLQQMASEDNLERSQAESAVAALVSRSVSEAVLKYGLRPQAPPSLLLAPSTRRRIARTVYGRPHNCIKQYEEGRLRAALTPLLTYRNGAGDSLGRPIQMRMSRLTVGWSDACDVTLTRYGHCNYVSKMHAVIFYDDVTRYFELMNYSEYGTRVNGALYSCDMSGSAETLEPATRAVQDLVKKRRPNCFNKALCEKENDFQVCQCKPGARLTNGWEGSAILQHGTVLHFGCMMFVFSIADCLQSED